MQPEAPLPDETEPNPEKTIITSIDGDKEKDKLNNRTKRLFNDPVGLAAATKYNVGLFLVPAILAPVLPPRTGGLRRLSRRLAQAGRRRRAPDSAGRPRTRGP